MKQEFMRIGGARTEKEFYEIYPTEQDFIKKHGGAINKLMAKGGEAYPQTATMDNFFSYGVPVPPTYYRQGGAFPMAQPENQFFSHLYGNVPNPYNKAMGGSAEAYPQSMSFPYGNTGRSTHFMMQDGGDMPEDQTIPKMGVNGKLLEFVGTIKNTAANKLNSNLATYGKVKNPEQYEFEQAKYGGNLKGYQSKDTSGGINNYNYKFNKGNLFGQRDLPEIDYNSDKGTVTNNYYYGPGQQGQQDPNNLPPEYTNDVDYLYGRRRPYSDFNIKGRGALGKYRATGTLEEEYGLEKLREMGLRDVAYDRPKWYQLLKRPRTTYHFDPYTQPNQTTQQPASSTPGQVDQQNMNASNTSNGPGTNVANNASNVNTPVAPTISQQGSPDNMGFLARMFNRPGNMVPNPANITQDYKNLNPDRNTLVDTNNPAGWNPYMSDFRNQIVQNRRRRTFDKLNDLNAHKIWQKDMLGKAYDAMDVKPAKTRDQYSDIELQGWRGRQEQRLLNRQINLDEKVNAQSFQGKDTSSEKKSRRQQRESAPSSYQQYRTPMTLEEYNAKKEIEARDKAAVEKQIRDSNVPPSEMPPFQPVVESNEPEAPTTMTEDVYTNAPASNSAPMFSLSSYDQFYPQNMFENDTYVPSYEFPTYADKQIPTGQERLQYFQKAVEAGLIPGNFVTNDPKEIQRHNDIINAYARSNSSSGAPFNYSAGPIERKMGGSSGNYNAGDVVDMTPEEIQRFIQMGGQIEFLD